MGDFLYKREVNKSVLWDGFGIERDQLNFFIDKIGKLNRGEKRDIKLIFEGMTYNACIKNLNNPADRRVNDAYQMRYTANGELAKALQTVFHKTFSYIKNQQGIEKASGEKKRLFIKVPDEYKEYIALYSTEYDDTFICEPIISDDMAAIRTIAKMHSERSIESEFDYEIYDENAKIETRISVVKVRKLNTGIGKSLKRHYEFRCQICGQKIGDKYGSNMIEAHHIDYFVKSLNNDLSNLLVVCPNHHSVIHDRNPQFNREKKTYLYPNGLEEGLILNDHL